MKRNEDTVKRQRSPYLSFNRVLKRYSWIIGLLLILHIFFRVGMTAELCLTNQPSDVQEPESVDMFEEPLRQMIGYWNKNTDVSISFFIKPHERFVSVFTSAQDKASSNFKNHYGNGTAEVWGFLSTMMIHGTLENTSGIVMIIAGLLFWISVILNLSRVVNKATGIFSHISISDKNVQKLGIQSIFDLVILLIIGFGLIILAGPIEAFISWYILLPIFTEHLWMSITYLVSLPLLISWIFFIQLEGYEQFKKVGSSLTNLTTP